MKQLLTTGIVLSRINYQEADRILTILTPDYGKLRVLAKGARKSKSKLAGGVELFSVSEIGFMRGRGELSTLVSSRLIKYYDTIVQDINRTMLGYELIKLLNKVTEEEPGPEYFDLLRDTLVALDDAQIHEGLIKLWFQTQLLRLAGHTPNLRTDKSGKPLEQSSNFAFDHEDMVFEPRADATYTADHLKLLRLVFSYHQPGTLQKVQGTEALLPACLGLIRTILPNHIRT